MQRYVQQLVDELGARARQRIAEIEANHGERTDVVRPGGPPDDDFDELYGDMADHFRDVEAYLAGPTEGITQTLAYYADIDLAELPPPDQLGAGEAQALYDALRHLLRTYGHAMDLALAEDAPPQLYYRFVLGQLAKQTVMMSGGFSGHDCQTYAPGCEFGQYCGCLEYWTKSSFVEAGGDASIPDERFPTEEELRANHPEITDDFDLPFGDDESPGWSPNGDRPAACADVAGLQAEVDDYIKTTGVRYFNELTNTAILAEEVGEVARLAARLYGEQSFKREADAASAKTDWADELSDVLFVLTCLANQTGVDLTEAFAKGMAKRNSRDKDRHRGNEKLRDRDPDMPF